MTIRWTDKDDIGIPADNDRLPITDVSEGIGGIDKYLEAEQIRQVKVSIGDTTVGYLENKLVDGVATKVTLNNDEGNETLQIDLDEVTEIKFVNGESVTWSTDKKTIQIPTGLGPVLQVGQELYVLVYNQTGGPLANGRGIHPSLGLPVGGIIPVEYADNITHEGFLGGVFVTTMDIPNGTVGFATTYGRVSGIDTSAYAHGQILYLDNTGNGTFTNTKPDFPEYTIQIGGTAIVDPIDGEILVDPKGTAVESSLNAFNGTMREALKFNVTSNGTVITGTLQRKDESGDLTMVWSTGFEMLNVHPTPLTLSLVAGTDEIHAKNYVYIPITTKVLTVSSVDFPTTIEHIKIATILCQSASSVQIDGVLRNQNWNDPFEDEYNMGHIAHIGERLRQENSKWDSGTEATVEIVTAPSPDNVYLHVTSGFSYQMHKQLFPSIDMPSDPLYVVNHPTSAYTRITDLNTQLTDASGGSLVGRYFNVVVWGAVASAGDENHLFVNLPSGSYNSSDDAIDDNSSFSVYDVPKNFRGVGFLIARFTFRHQTIGSGTWTLVSTRDLRGSIPNNIAGGSGGGSGVTSYLALTDTPSSFSGNALKTPTVNAGASGLEFTEKTSPSDVLVRTNTDVYTPSSDYHPATKKYVDDNSGGAGDTSVSIQGNVIDKLLTNFIYSNAGGALGSATGSTFLTTGQSETIPQDIFWSSDLDRFLVAGDSKAEILRYDSSGVYVDAFSTFTGAGVADPTGVVFDGTNYYVTSLSGSDVSIFNSAGVYQSQWTVTGAGSNLSGLALKDDSLHCLYGTNIRKFTKAGVDEGIITTLSEDSSPGGISWDGTNFWMVGRNTDNAYKYDSDWNYLGVSLSLTTGESNPSGITIKDGYAWVIGYANDEAVEYGIGEANVIADSDTNNVLGGLFEVGDILTISGTASNDGDYTVEIVLANSLIVTEVLVNETIESTVILTNIENKILTANANTNYYPKSLTPGPGMWTKITEVDVSTISATTAEFSLDLTTYERLMFVLEDIGDTFDDGQVGFGFQVSSSDQNLYSTRIHLSSISSVSASDLTSLVIPFCTAQPSDANVLNTCGHLILSQMRIGGRASFEGKCYAKHGSSQFIFTELISGYINTTSLIDKIKLTGMTGALERGTFQIWGVKR